MAQSDIIFYGTILEEEGADLWTEGALTKLGEFDWVLEEVDL